MERNLLIIMHQSASSYKENMRHPVNAGLEVGVGGGWLVRHLQELGYQVAGCDVDLSNFQGEEAERLGLRKANPDGTLAFESNEFDVVVSCDVLEAAYPVAS